MITDEMIHRGAEALGDEPDPNWRPGHLARAVLQAALQERLDDRKRSRRRWELTPWHVKLCQVFQPYHVGAWLQPDEDNKKTMGFTTRRRALQASNATGLDIAHKALRQRLGLPGYSKPYIHANFAAMEKRRLQSKYAAPR